MAKIADVIREQESALLDISGVTGVGQTQVDDQECIVVMLEQSLQRLRPQFLPLLEVTLSSSRLLESSRRFESDMSHHQSSWLHSTGCGIPKATTATVSPFLYRRRRSPLYVLSGLPQPIPPR